MALTSFGWTKREGGQVHLPSRPVGFRLLREQRSCGRSSYKRPSFEPEAFRQALSPGPSALLDNRRGYQEVLKDRKSTRLNSSHVRISYAVFCLKKKKKTCNTYYTKCKYEQTDSC